MHRREFLRVAWRAGGISAVSVLTLGSGGCRRKQFARVLKPGEQELVGSHKAGGETYKPLVDEAVAKLLARHESALAQPASYSPEGLPPPRLRVCFVGVENKSAEEIADFKEQIFQNIDSKILESHVFQSISRRYVDAGLHETRLRPDELMVPQNMRMFADYMEQSGQPFDYLLYATLTSGTTHENGDYQRDYLLTLELVNVNTGEHDKQSAEISKGYHQSRLGRWTAKNPFNML
jgi:hypothetical protein